MKPQHTAIDCTPIWTGILRVLLELFQSNKAGRDTAVSELFAMARTADLWNAHAEELINAARAALIALPGDAILKEGGRAARKNLLDAVTRAEKAAHDAKRGR